MLTLPEFLVGAAIQYPDSELPGEAYGGVGDSRYREGYLAGAASNSVTIIVYACSKEHFR